ncbi:phosphatidylinositol glycan anchor biosynthesis class M [Oratosquilla oratoria]|uniref:phosphatidylinositol glycan anchor biosynthesis class M n=1 Tax=Oratosquilla oratoria TaxID=337810 RepID=UPI003F777786
MAIFVRSSKSRYMEGIRMHLFLGFFVRLIFIAYGAHHDRINVLKYTDVDYHVFTDAAREVMEGNSPFERHTYRYTPFLAWMMIPNVAFHFLYGKFLFSLLDCVAAKIMYQILLLEGHMKSTALQCSFLWLYNPLVIGVSTRGSAESLMAVLVLHTLFLMKSRYVFLAGLMYGTSVHFKLYPIIYSIPLYLSLTSDANSNSLIKRLMPNKAKMKLVLGAAFSFFGLTILGFILYGEQYIEEGFLYHLTRTDTRHNFSVYFYLLYLSADYHIMGINFAIFGPQMLLLVILGFKFGNRLDLPFAVFTQTVIFVTFNKVVTSQYFLWYLQLLPIIAPKVAISKMKACVLTVFWVAAQASWLLPAYLLEFHSINAFVPLWLEGIAFFCCNVGILMALLSGYTMLPIVQHHNTRKNR